MRSHGISCYKMTKGKLGRPTIYSDELAKEICMSIAKGKSVRHICKPEDMPAMSTIFLWLLDNDEFSEQYARAKTIQAMVMEEDIIEIVDGDGDVQRDKLRAETRKWLMTKLAAKKYGEKIQQEITGKDGGPIKTDSMPDLSNLTEDQLKVLKTISAGASQANEA